MSRSAGYSIAALRSRARPLDRWPISPSAGASIASPPSTAHSDCRQPRCARRRCPLAEHQPTPISSHAVRCRFAPSETTAAPSGRGIQRRAKYSPGKASMTVSPPAAAAGPLWEAPAVGSVTSSSIKVMTQASSPNASDSSGSLSPRAAGAQQIENGVHRRPHFGLARPPTGPHRRDHWLQPRPLRVPKSRSTPILTTHTAR